ncbi:sensor histidine kinase [Synergistales bacterium]|nr:sensor histidine kinase [Synergistales bacterium]
MRKAIYVRFVIIALITAVLCGVISAALYAVNEEKQTREHLSALCFAVSRIYEANPDAGYLRGVAGGSRVTIVAPDGTVLADSSETAGTMGNHGNREEIIIANAKTPVTVSRKSETLSSPFMYAAIKLSDGNILRLAQKYSGVGGGIVRQLPIVIIALTAALLIAAFIANTFTKKVIYPLEKAADDIAAGSYDVLAGGGYYEVEKITDRIKTLLDKINNSRQETAAEKNKIEYILSGMPEGFVLLDANKKIQLAGDSAKKIFRRESDIAGRDISVLTRNAKIAESVHKAVTENSFGIFDLNIDDAVYSVRVSPVSEGEFGASGVTILLVDVTAERKAQSLRSEFFTNASHELKTPITSIMGFSQMLENGLADTQKSAEICARISAESQRMSNLIADILTISRLESETAAAETESVDLGEAARGVSDALAFQAREANVAVTLDCGAVYVNANREQMYNLLNNLVDNAIKYNVPNGTVNVSAQSQKRGAVLTVADTGIGIASAAQGRIFERFYRASAERGKTVAGTGLGLAIVKHIVSGLSGEIALESAPGKGTRITVVLPEHRPSV